MGETTQIQHEETESRTDSEAVSKFLSSRELRQGFKLHEPTIEVETRLVPKKWFQLEKSKKLKLGIRHNSSGNQSFNIAPVQKETAEIVQQDDEYVESSIDSDDVEFTLNTLDVESEADVIPPNRFDIVSPETVDSAETGDMLLVLHKESGRFVGCEVQHNVSLSFQDSMGEERTLYKEFETKREAESFVERIQDKSSQGKVNVDYDEGFNVSEEYTNFWHVFASNMITDEDEEESFMKNLVMIAMWTSWLSILFDFLPLLLPVAILTFMFGYVTVIGWKSRKELEDGKIQEEYKFSSETDGIGVDESLSEAKTSRRVNVETRVDEGEVVVEPDEIDATWSFDVEDGVISEDGVEFFDNGAGLEVLSDGYTEMEVKITCGEDCLGESDDGNWHLYRGI